MAPPSSRPADAPSNPLADYFYIAGIESSSIYDQRSESPLSPVVTTIDEDAPLVTDLPGSPRPGSPTSPQNTSFARQSNRFSYETRKSLAGVISPTADVTSPISNRSSAATLKGLQAATMLNEEDFEQALRKFASERDSILDEIHISTITATTPQPKPMRQRPKTMRIAGPEDIPSSSGRGGVGSLRRRLSTMSTMKKSTVPDRQASVHTNKRTSTYNSVIPTPEPFKVDPRMHPLKRRYEPVLLDRYPTKDMVDESKRRCAFPDYVPMFAFPNDVGVISADERPRSTWHGFAMTSADGSRLHSICVVVWTPLAADASAELEAQCEAWRRANMTSEERELASSLGERLAAERAKLSRLLSQLPATASESDERENLEDEISSVEERIGLMADLLRPVRHAAASKIEGLTQNETGFWIPRVYGLLGRDAGMTSFWKEWLKAVVVPMTDGGILNVPASSPRVGMWQPLERYVVNICVEAPSPLTSLTQVEVAIRELKLYARKEAINELPGSRNTDLYALFRALSIPTIVSLFECAIAESRIILTSSHISMLHLASQALSSLLYPLNWTGIFIPVLPNRLLQALEAPCPYIIGIERNNDIDWPTDDFVLVDLDDDLMEGTAPPKSLPRPIRRKLTSLLQAAAPHHNRFGVPVGPPAYAVETFPNSLFSSENTHIFNANATKANMAANVTMSSTAFLDPNNSRPPDPLVNVFVSARNEMASRQTTARPGTSSTNKSGYDSAHYVPPSPTISVTGSFPPTPVSRNDSAFGLQTALREKRSGHFDSAFRRSSSFGLDRVNPLRRPSMAPSNATSLSLSTSSMINGQSPGYAPSVYAPSTLAASTIMPSMLMQPVKDTATHKWIEGHSMMRTARPKPTGCSICSEKCTDEAFQCAGCTTQVHAGCMPSIGLPCPQAFRPDLVRAAFIRCWASLLFTYRRALLNGARHKDGLLYHFDSDLFMKSVPAENAEFVGMLRETQAFSEFVHERESRRVDDPSIRLFDEIILSKKNRGRSRMFSRSAMPPRREQASVYGVLTRRAETSFLSDSSDHLWRSAAAVIPSSRFPGDYRQIVSRIPARLDPTLMKEPRATQGAPRITNKGRAARKPIPSLLGINTSDAGLGVTKDAARAGGVENLDPVGVGRP